ncbi:MAG TPA: hypothetical protein VNI78_07290 [Vicinamibacterales bacterium]|nr:hypothetical protein [Vicinamibacterales bacterium]
MELVAEYRAGNLTVKEFAAKHDLPLSTLQYWLYKRSKQSSSSQHRVQRFLPVSVVASPAPQLARAGVIEATLRSGLVVRFTAGTDTRYLAELLAALG